MKKNQSKKMHGSSNHQDAKKHTDKSYMDNSPTKKGVKKGSYKK